MRTDPRIEEAPMGEQRRSGEGRRARDSADHDRHQLLEAVSDSECFEHLDGGEETHQMAKEHDEHPDVKQHRSGDELTPAENLAGT